MSLPFTTEQFFEILARYKESIWPMQLVLNASALVCIGLLFRAGVWSSRIINLILSVLWAWMAVAYHFALFSGINSAAWVFGAIFLAGSLALAWFGAVRTNVLLRLLPGARTTVAAILIVFALVLYPIAAWVLGHHYPKAPTFGLSCPTTIVTLGILLLSVRPIYRWVFVVPLFWVAVGTLAAFQLGVTEDLGLLAAGTATIVVMLMPSAPAGAVQPAGDVG